MGRAARILIAIAVATLLPSDAAARWTTLRSPNFQFIGDAPAGQIREVARKLEQFREVMARALPGATAASPVPTTVVVFATQRSLSQVAPLFRGNPTEVGGYFLSGEDRNYIAVDGEYIDLALMTVFHEYAHALVTNTVGRVPPWLNEGLAEFYQVMQTLDGGKSIVIGRAPAQHIELLKGSTLMPIKELLSIDRNSQVYNEGNRRGVFYAQSWALTHYFTLGSKERAPQFRNYLASLRAGVKPDDAFTEAFGADTSALDRELFDYVRQFTFLALRLNFDEKVQGDADRGTTMADVDAEIHVADLQARIGREEEARTRLQAIVGRKPDAALAWSALGLIDFRAGKRTEALLLLERAAGQDPRDGFVQTAFGRALVAAMNEQPNSEARMATLQKARAALSRAVEIDANSAYAAGLLGYVELAVGADLPRAVSLLERASTLAPSREQYRVLLAQALMEQGEYQRAINYLGPLVAGGSSPEVRSDARRVLSDVGDRAARKASGTAPPPVAAERPLPLLSSVAEIPVSTGRETIRLDLRPVKEGETRVLGLFKAIECLQAGIVLHVDTDGRVLRLSAKQMSDIDFITYRSDPAGSVTCGPLPKAVRVLATYRAKDTSAASSTSNGDAVAIELLPDEYSPPR